MEPELVEKLQSSVEVLKDVQESLRKVDVNKSDLEERLSDLLHEFFIGLRNILAESEVCRQKAAGFCHLLSNSSSSDESEPKKHSIKNETSNVKKCAVHVMKLAKKSENDQITKNQGSLLTHKWPGNKTRKNHQRNIFKRNSTSKKGPTTGVVKPFKHGIKKTEEKMVSKKMNVLADVHMPVSLNTSMNVPPVDSFVFESSDSTVTSVCLTNPMTYSSDFCEPSSPECNSAKTESEKENVIFNNSSPENCSTTKTSHTLFGEIENQDEMRADDLNEFDCFDEVNGKFQSSNRKTYRRRPRTLKRRQLKWTCDKSLMVPVRDASVIMEVASKMKNFYCCPSGLNSLTIASDLANRKLIKQLADTCHFSVSWSTENGISLRKTRRSRPPSAVDIESVLMSMD